MKVSICIPAYKQIDYLKRTLDSVLNQDYLNYEVIITDDTRDDSVKEVVMAYTDKFDGKLNYFKNLSSLGSPQNWNEAIRLSQGEYIKILHHDDWFTFPDSLSKIMSHVISSECDWAFCATNIVFHNSKDTRIHLPSKIAIEEIKSNPSDLIFGNIIGSPSTVILKRKVKEEFDVRLKWLVDVEYYIRLIDMNYKLSYLDEPLISTITGAEHTVTSAVTVDINVELFENLYLLERLSLQQLNFLRLIKHFLMIFRRYEKGLPTFRREFPGVIPFYLRVVLLLERACPRVLDKTLHLLESIFGKVQR